MERKMGRKARPSREAFGFVVLIFALSFFVPSTAPAHPPASVILDYQGGARTLTVTVAHRVSNPASHYIESIRVWKKRTLVQEYSYTSQPDKEGVTYTYDIPAEEGDVLRVEASCSVFGSRSEELTVTLPTESHPEGRGIPAVDGIVMPGEYPSRQEFGNGTFAISWRIEGNLIDMALEGKTAGWISIGFGPTEAMKDADMVFGWVNEEGKAFSVDAYATGRYGPHPPDANLGGTNDIASFAGREENGVTVIEFTRLLDTGDRYDKKLPLSGPLDILWALGPSDKFTDRHAVRGKGMLTLGK